MKVEIQEDDQFVFIRPQGKLDAITAPGFEESVIGALEDDSLRVVIDMTDVPYVSSAGLRVFIKAAKQVMRSGKLAVFGMSANVQQVFELAGFDKIMNLCGDLETAKQA